MRQGGSTSRREFHPLCLRSCILSPGSLGEPAKAPPHHGHGGRVTGAHYLHSPPNSRPLKAHHSLPCASLRPALPTTTSTFRVSLTAAPCPGLDRPTSSPNRPEAMFCNHFIQPRARAPSPSSLRSTPALSGPSLILPYTPREMPLWPQGRRPSHRLHMPLVLVTVPRPDRSSETFPES